MEVFENKLVSYYKNFSRLIEEKDKKPFKSFVDSEFITKYENYKYAVHNAAQIALNIQSWEREDIGTGRIYNCVENAISVKSNNLLNWRQSSNFRNGNPDKILENIIYEFYKNQTSEEDSFSLLQDNFSYQFIAFLFFLKDKDKYLPISQRKFDVIFKQLGIHDFKTEREISWDNYISYCDIVMQAKNFLNRKNINATLLDAHTFLWMKSYLNLLSVDEWIEILNNKDLTKEVNISIFQALYTFENHQTNAKQIGLLLGHSGKTPQSSINLEIGRYGKRIANKYDIDLSIREKQEYKFWDIFFNGWADGNLFVWELKDEIVEALEFLNITGDYPSPDEIISNNFELPEGVRKKVTVNAYERNPKAREICLAKWGVRCIVCGFNFEEKYGKIGKDYIHVHHLNPISQIGKEYNIDPINDLNPICPNCHSMLHKKNPPFLPDELKKLIADN